MDDLNSQLTNALKQIGIVDFDKVSKNHKSNLRPIKAIYQDVETRNKHLKENPMITLNGKNTIIITAPNCKPINQCDKCKRFGHKSQDCEDEMPTCGFCSEEHYDNECQAKNEKVNCANCNNAHDAYNRTCEVYQVTRRNAEKIEMEKIFGTQYSNNLTENPSTKNDKEANFHRVFSLESDLKTISTEIKFFQTQSEARMIESSSREDKLIMLMEQNHKLNNETRQAMNAMNTNMDNKCQLLYNQVTIETDQKLLDMKKQMTSFIVNSEAKNNILNEINERASTLAFYNQTSKKANYKIDKNYPQNEIQFNGNNPLGGMRS
jgi:hypothetical protein